MDKIDQYFHNTEKISFIELQSDSYKGLDKNIAYPIETDIVVKGIKDSSFADEISYQHILDGMILCIAIDSDFKFNDKYMSSLENILTDIEDYTITRAQGLQENNNEEKALYYYRFLNVSGLSNSYSDYNYGRALYKIYEKEEEIEFRDRAIKILESIISDDGDFPLSYYELGIIYTKEANYNKAYLYLEKALERVDDDLAKEELREYMRDIYPHALMERGINDLYRSDLDGAYKHFRESKQVLDSALVNYYLAVVYEAKGDLTMAIDYYKYALDKEGQFRELYQDLAIAYFKKGELGNALESLDEGLKIHHEDASLLYNRMVIYIGLDRIDLAKKDMETILQYGDVDEEILQNINIIKQEYGI